MFQRVKGDDSLPDTFHSLRHTLSVCGYAVGMRPVHPCPDTSSITLPSLQFPFTEGNSHVPRINHLCLFEAVKGPEANRQ